MCQVTEWRVNSAKEKGFLIGKLQAFNDTTYDIVAEMVKKKEKKEANL